MWQKLLQGFQFITGLVLQLEAVNSTPVGQSATITFDAAHLLEVSEGNEHWKITGVTATRVK